MDPRCRIELFGGLRVLRGDESITRFRTQKAATLLSYLALHLRQNHSREQLIDLFWPEMDLDAGRDNLSTALTTLRRQLEPAGVPSGFVLIADRRNARLNPDAASTDVDEYAQLLRAAAGARNQVERTALLQRATGLYRGDLLPGCYEEWAVQEQRRWSERHADALQQLAAAHEEAGDLEAALTAAQHVVQHDPYCEQAYQAQMRLHAALGDRVLALHTYHQFRAFLETELGVSPAQATRELAEQLRRDPGAVTARSAAHREPRPEAGTPAPRPEGEPAASPHPPVPAEAVLPPQFTRFFGREAETARLGELLGETADNRRQTVNGGGNSLPPPDYRRPSTAGRLVTVTGPGGAGKTRLAIETARHLAPDFGGRVWFVELAALPDPNLIPFAVAHALKLPSHPSADLLEAAVQALGEAPCLLLLDNFEHLLRDTHAAKGDASASAGGGPALVRLLLERVPRLTCLVTSRQALQLGGEQEFPLPPLGIPRESDTPERLLEYGSVALYADRARLAKPDFALTTQNAAAVSTLCRRLEGMPLAIEMAAAWAKTLPPTRMLERLERQLDLLVSRQRDLPPRHQSLRATIEWSYDLLPPLLQQFFARLSVFRGGWTLEAAEAVCGADGLALLAQLQDRSLVVLEEQEEGTRYRILEPLREYAAEKLEAHGEIGLVRGRHAAFFLALAEQAEPELYGREKKQWLDRLEVDFDNLRAALAWYDADEGGAVMGLRLAGALRLFWSLRGHQTEGREWLERALQRAPVRTEARGKALDAAGNIARELGELEIAQARFEESLAIREELGDRHAIADSYNNLGLVAIDQKEYRRARSLHEQSMAIMREVGDRRGIAHSLFNLGVLAREQGDPQAARAYWAECRAVDQALGVKGGVLNWVLGELAQEQGTYNEAGQHWRTGLIECREIGFKGGVRRAIEYLASLALLEGQPRRSARLWGAATAIHEANGTSFQPAVQAAFERDAGQIRAALGEESFRSSFAEGRAFTMEQAFEYARESKD